MKLQSETVEQACAQISREIRDYRRNVHIHFIVHHLGQRTEALGVAAQEILSHPAAETAMHILQKQRKSEDSVLLGTAVAKQNIFFGLASRDSVLALCTINIDQFESLRDVRRQAYHLVWHALDATEYHGDPRNRTGESREVLVRRRNALQQSLANMRADIFSAVICSLSRDTDAVRGIAAARSHDTLHTRALHAPEYYPYPTAMDAADFAIRQINVKAIAKKRLVPTALTVAHEVGLAFKEEDIRNWLSFAESAQDMAWRGYGAAEILSAAVNTSPNTYVRNIGHLLASLTQTTPTSIFESRENYSPFADGDFNEKLHAKIMDEIFQDVIAQGLRQNSEAPFTAMANQQNNALSEGRVLGWCASALQAAGVAYKSAADKGEKPDLSAQKIFAEKKGDAPWDNLQTLGRKVIRAQRQGRLVGLDDLKDMADETEGLGGISESIARSLDDPHYRQRLEAVSELYQMPAPAAMPGTPAPKMPQPQALPATPAFMPAPALGPGGGAAHWPAKTPPVATKAGTEKSAPPAEDE